METNCTELSAKDRERSKNSILMDGFANLRFFHNYKPIKTKYYFTIDIRTLYNHGR